MRLFDTDRWSEIGQTIARNKKRSIMTALGIFWGIFMLTVMLGAGSGLSRMLGSVLGDMTTNTMFLFTDQTSLPWKGMPAERHWQIDNDDVAALRTLDEVEYADGMLFGGSYDCTRGERRGSYALMGLGPAMQRIHPQPLLYGRYINDMDMTGKRKVCVIGTQVWRELFPEGGDPSGATIKVGSSYFRVVGVLQKKGEINVGSSPETQIAIPMTLAQQLLGRGDKVEAIAVAGRPLPPAEVERAVRQSLFARNLIAPDDPRALWVLSMGELFENAMKLIRGIDLLTWIVGLGTLLAGIVGVSNIMLVLVKERTQEIGIRRAIGAPPAAIIGQILSESFVLTFVAGTVGLAAGVGLLSAADTLYAAASPEETVEGVSWQITFATGMLSLAILLAGSLLAGIIPAVRALSIKAVDAIREE